MKSFATLIAIGISLFGYIPYIRDSVKGKTKPHLLSWATWALISFIAFGIQFLNHGGAGAFINLYMGIICTIIFVIALKNGVKQVKKVDIVAFVLALVAIVLWLVVKQPLLSIILVVLIDMLSFFPTIRKSWSSPNEETLATWVLSCVKNALSIYALGQYSLLNLLYPVYSLVANVGFSVLLVVRRKK